jgi:hypothetical protein
MAQSPAQIGHDPPALPHLDALNVQAGQLLPARVLARLGLSRDLAGLLLDDLKRAVMHFAKHPSATSSTPYDAGGYHHT